MVAVGIGSFAKSGRVLLADDGMSAGPGTGAKSLAQAGLLALAGGAVGAGILLLSPDKVFVFVVPYLVALASIALLLQPRLRARMGERASHPAWWLVGVFTVSIYGGYFGAGAGVMFVALAMVLTALPLWRATLLKSALLGIANAVAAVGFIIFSEVHWVQPSRWVSAASPAAGPVLPSSLGFRPPRCASPSGSAAWASPSGLPSALDRTGRGRGRPWKCRSHRPIVES